jgi:diguanylate cyclase (GGDEF)-like protein
MTNEGASRTQQGLNVLLIDSDPDFLVRSCKLIAEDGHRAWGAEDLLAAANFLADHRPDLLLVELALLDADGADPLGDLRARALGAPAVLMASGPPGDRFQFFSGAYDIFGYHDKQHGGECLRMWVNAAQMAARQLDKIRNTRQGLRHLLDAAPELHKIQSLDEVMEAILAHIDSMVGGQGAFVAARMTDPVGRPALEGLADHAQTINDYVVGATSKSSYPRGTTLDQLQSVPVQLLRRAVEERSNIIDDKHGVLPLALADQVLGLAYLDRPSQGEGDLELLQVFATQAAAAIRNAALYDLATVDPTTRLLRKEFTLERLRETIKLAWRKVFPVSVLMLDLDNFKELNNQYGHVVGDRTLRHIGELLKSNVRDSDIVGRFGGDEFIIALIDSDRAGAVIVAERLQHAMMDEQGRTWPEGLQPLKASMGLSSIEPGDDPAEQIGFPNFPLVAEALVEQADAAMLAAKRKAKWMFASPPLAWKVFQRR